MKKVKRYLAVLLVTCLFISMLVPTETGAEETEAETIVSVSASSLKNNGYDAEYEYAVVSDNQPVVSENVPAYSGVPHDSLQRPAFSYRCTSKKACILWNVMIYFKKFFML